MGRGCRLSFLCRDFQTTLLLKSATVPCSNFSSFYVCGNAFVRYVVAELTNTTLSYRARVLFHDQFVIIELKHLSQLLIYLDFFNCYEIKIYQFSVEILRYRNKK